ncbi:MAG: hypothetical protein AB1714_19085 [Acidobacteriota bacterium]
MSLESEETDRLRRAFAELSSRAAPREDCPQPDQIWDAVSGKIERQVTSEVIEHTIVCPVCAEAWRLARRLTEDLTEIEGCVPQIEPQRVAHWPWYRMALLAAAAVLVVAVGLDQYIRRRGGSIAEEPSYRGSPGQTIRSLLAEDAVLRRDQFILRWTPGPAGSRYTLRVATTDLTILDAVSGIATAEYRVPPSTLADLPSGTQVAWQVEAVLPDGSRIRSPTFFVRVE